MSVTRGGFRLPEMFCNAGAAYRDDVVEVAARPLGMHQRQARELVQHASLVVVGKALDELLHGSAAALA